MFGSAGRRGEEKRPRGGVKAAFAAGIGAGVRFYLIPPNSPFPVFRPLGCERRWEDLDFQNADGGLGGDFGKGFSERLQVGVWGFFLPSRVCWGFGVDESRFLYRNALLGVRKAACSLFESVPG